MEENLNQETPQGEPQVEQPTPTEKKQSHVILLLSVFIVLLVVAVGSYFLYFSNPVDEVEVNTNGLHIGYVENDVNTINILNSEEEIVDSITVDSYIFHVVGSLSPDGKFLFYTWFVGDSGGEGWIYEVGKGTHHRLEYSVSDTKPSLWLDDGRFDFWRACALISDCTHFRSVDSNEPWVLEEVIDTSAWQTYRNEEFGFSIQYPSSWVSFEQGGIGSGFVAFGSSENAYASWARPIPINESFVSISPNKQSISEFSKLFSEQEDMIRKYNEENQNDRIEYEIISQESLTVNGHRVIKVISTLTRETPGSDGLVEGYSISYGFENKYKGAEYLYSVSLLTAIPLTSTTESHTELFEEIVKTFNYEPTDFGGASTKTTTKEDAPQVPQIP